LRSACDIKRACRPICASPISPSISAFGTSAATESTTTTSDAIRADQDLHDFERLLAVVRLRHQQVVDVDSQLLRIQGVERVLGVHERGHASELLAFGDDLQGQRRLARRFRSEDFDDAAARHAPDAERVVDADGAGGDEVDRLDGAFLAQAHDGALAELLLDLAHGQLHGLGRSRSCLSSILSIGICGLSSEGSSILETCLAKVNGKSVHLEPEHTEHQILSRIATFASLARRSQNLPS
jgi:hypothetical protein